MEKCIKCKNYDNTKQGCLYMDADCKNGEKFEPITNYDRIKSMSVGEMANFLSEAEWKAMQGKSKYPHEWEQWLLQEVSDNDR